MSCDHEMLLASKMAVASSCSVDEAIRKSLCFSKCGKGKTKEMYRFIVKKEGCTWIASSWVWKKLDLAIASVSSLFTKQNTLIVFLHCSTNNHCFIILAIKLMNLDTFWMAHNNLLTCTK